MIALLDTPLASQWIQRDRELMATGTHHDRTATAGLAKVIELHFAITFEIDRCELCLVGRLRKFHRVWRAGIVEIGRI